LFPTEHQRIIEGAVAHLRSTRETPVDARRPVWQESEGASRPTVELSWPPTAEDLDTVEVITAESCAAPLPIARLDTSLPADVFADTDADLDRFRTEARDDRSDSAPPVAPSSSMRGRQLLLAAASLLVAAVLSQLLTS